MGVYNAEYAQQEFECHGESWLQERIAKDLYLNTIFDVGSNIGEWNRMVRKHQPNATIHTFEIIPEAYHRMLSRMELEENLIPNSFGLHENTGMIPYLYKPGYDVMTTTLTDLGLENSEMRLGLVVSGDDYVKMSEVDTIDFLKIDTEGAEGRVFKGFKKTIAEGRVRIIQFEYTLANILDRWFLKDSYDFLIPHQYKIGKLYKDHIKFEPYALIMEDFGTKGSTNVVAVHKTYWKHFNL